MKLSIEQLLAIAKEASEKAQTIFKEYCETYPGTLTSVKAAALSQLHEEAYDDYEHHQWQFFQHFLKFFSNSFNRDMLDAFSNIYGYEKAYFKPRIGNCLEQALYAYFYILKRYGHVLDLKETPMSILHVAEDHVILAIGITNRSTLSNPATWGSLAIICDPLLQVVIPAKNYAGVLKQSDGVSYDSDENMICEYQPFQLPDDWEHNVNSPQWNHIIELPKYANIRECMPGNPMYYFYAWLLYSLNEIFSDSTEDTLKFYDSLGHAIFKILDRPETLKAYLKGGLIKQLTIFICNYQSTVLTELQHQAFNLLILDIYQFENELFSGQAHQKSTFLQTLSFLKKPPAEDVIDLNPQTYPSMMG